MDARNSSETRKKNHVIFYILHYSLHTRNKINGSFNGRICK